jgi:hypothetical protein
MERSKLLSMLSIYAGLAEMGMSQTYSKKSNTNDGSYGHGVPDKAKKPIPNGCKEYYFYGYTVVAISEKSAEKKAYKLYKKQNP